MPFPTPLVLVEPMPDSFSNDFEGLEKALGYQFKDKSLLIQALTHKSYAGYNREDHKLRW